MKTGFSPVAFQGVQRPKFGNNNDAETVKQVAGDWLDNLNQISIESLKSLRYEDTDIRIRRGNEVFSYKSLQRGTAPSHSTLTNESTGEMVLSYTSPGCFGVSSVRAGNTGRVAGDGEAINAVLTLFEKIVNLAKAC